MTKTWVLDTDTKGTGAEMVPLDKVLRDRRRARDAARRSRFRRRRDPPPEPSPEQDSSPEPARPRKFKVVNAISRETLTEEAGVREAVELLEGSRSVADMRVYVRESEGGEWRALSLREQMLLRGFRARAAD
jgi:hypothetical protein